MSSSPIVEIGELGRRIRKLRDELRLTLKQVESECGLSATHLSEIERGRTSPTIGALVRIARALGKDASYFIEREERPEISLVTRERVRTFVPAPGVSAECLTPGIPGSRMFSYRLSLTGELSLAPDESEGEAIYLVRRGSLESEIGDTRATLGAGDAMTATLTLPHKLRPHRGGSVELIAVLSRSLEEPS